MYRCSPSAPYGPANVRHTHAFAHAHLHTHPYLHGHAYMHTRINRAPTHAKRARASSHAHTSKRTLPHSHPCVRIYILHTYRTLRTPTSYTHISQHIATPLQHSTPCLNTYHHVHCTILCHPYAACSKKRRTVRTIPNYLGRTVSQSRQSRR